MAFTDLAGPVAASKQEIGAFRRFVATFFAARSERVEAASPRKLAGPVPGDARARGYMGDLDIEVGF